MSDPSFNRIAVIGAGTMGAGIAGQIANAGNEVLLLDLPARGDGPSPAEKAVQRLVKSDPPALLEKACAARITTGDIEKDFHLLSQCDWVVEAIVERLSLKKELYRKLEAVIPEDCVVTSNTSTIPIRLLVEDMPKAFQKRFAITHYFNPVRYMRLLELVQGEETDPKIIARLAKYNDEDLGKGVVLCQDTPGFLGNRIGVFALQAGMDEAYRQGLSIEEADALMGRPLGIPKTGVFGLYDLIGIDLMADVVDTLGDILPKDDAFHAIGKNENPLWEQIQSLIKSGHTGEKGEGGFYRQKNGRDEALDLRTGAWRERAKGLPAKAQEAASLQAENKECLHALIAPSQNPAHDRFVRNFLGRVLHYAMSRIPEITDNPQDIDDAMKLGFNWVRGPFEMIDALGRDRTAELLEDAGLNVPEILEGGDFYSLSEDGISVRQASREMIPIAMPKGSFRLSMMRRQLTPIVENEAASLFALKDDLRILEFHSKANALNAQSMAIVKAAADDHGRGILVHNDAQHFSAGVDLNAFRTLIEAKDWSGIDHFLADFQTAVAALKYAPVPVIGAPSGLAIGGGFEVLAHCDKVIAHTNAVFGLVEAGVGLVPGGGGVKETYARWLDALDHDADKAAWETWMQIGYGKTGSSPPTSARLQYFLPDRDKAVMNRDKLVFQATEEIQAMSQNYMPPEERAYPLAQATLLPKMREFMRDGIEKGWFFPHDLTVAMAIATILIDEEQDAPRMVSENALFERERIAFLHLAQTEPTYERIKTMLDDGGAVRN